MMLSMVKSVWSRPQARRRSSRGGMHSSTSSTCGKQGLPQPGPQPWPLSPPARPTSPSPCSAAQVAARPSGMGR